MLNSDDIDKATRAVKRRVEALLGDLIAEPSVVGATTAIGATITSALADLDMDVRTIDVDPAALHRDPQWSPFETAGPLPNIVGSWPGSELRTVLFAHLDTEPVGDGSTWSSEPTVATRRGRRIYGLGAADDKAGVASVLGALLALDAAGIRPQGLAAAFVQGKAGGSGGTLPVWRDLARGGLAEDATAIYCHPAETGHGLADLKTGSRGLLTLRIDVTGEAPPPAEMRTPASADPAAGHNAVELAALVIDGVRAWVAHNGGQGARTTVTSISTPEATPYRVPDRCSVEIGVWFTVGTSRQVESAVRDHLRERLASHAWLGSHPPEITAVGLRADPARIDGRSRLVRAATRAIIAAGGPRPQAYRGHAASDIRFPILCAGIPAVGFGALGGGFYGPDEWVDVPSMHQTTEALVRLVMDLERTRTP